ncbi:MAG TPA: primosomal protein N' [Elusimicrobiota bacterium]|nr:primosomal protein N' [Elusimicrobiota bacterium]
MKIAEVAFPVPLPKGFHYLVPESMPVSAGCRVRAPFGPRIAVGTVVSLFDGEPQRPLKTLGSLVDSEPILPGELLECAVWMSRRYAAPIGECIRSVLPSFVKTPARRAHGLPPGSPQGATGQAPSAPFVLTPGQNRAVEFLGGRLAQRKFSGVLLYGVPASGKTEVYLRLIRRAIQNGGQALFLLPEISLTLPFFDEFSASLGVLVALWHSRLTPRQRREAWLGLASGDVKVVVGARSAALLPFKDLRLAVLDEEQDESFKQEGQSPYYHARELAFHRAQSWNALLVLGSATPSLESWKMARQGAVHFLDMPERVSASARPKVSVVPIPAGQALSNELLERVKIRLARREQSILLVNRRGFSTVLLCPKCGWVARCPSCGVAQIQHEAPGSGAFFELRCHHCSHREALPQACPRCRNQGLRAAGVGTQKVMAELRRILPGARVLRMDQDTLRAKEEKIYERFKAGEADILIGTKLVAKSFHFPNVTLVGVIDADSMIHMPDFRASERAMQLLAQVSGRSGRAGKEGEVVLQSLKPEHDAVAKTVDGDYAAFADAELLSRRHLGYPPHSTLIRLVWSGKSEEAVLGAAEKTAEELRAKLSQAGHEITGPAPAVVRMTQGKPRYHLLVKTPELGEIERAVSAVRACPVPSGVKRSINVDPYDLF